MQAPLDDVLVMLTVTALVLAAVSVSNVTLDVLLKPCVVASAGSVERAMAATSAAIMFLIFMGLLSC